MTKILSYFKMIKIEHTLFALPFAFSGMILAADGLPNVKTIFWIVVCMIGARSGAMGFNRYADAAIDAKNPRTAQREIPAGKISKNEALIFIVVSFALFIFGAYMLNPLAFMVTPIPIAIFFLYSYTKRFTSLCHFVLGLALGFAPIGAWIAVRGDLSLGIVLLGLGVLVWTAGFDILYALQDLDFDIKEKLFSIPTKLGVANSLILARVLHIAAFLLFIITGVLFNLGWIYLVGCLISGLIMVYEHYIIFKDGLKKLDIAFFNFNAYISIILFISTAISVWMR